MKEQQVFYPYLLRENQVGPVRKTVRGSTGGIQEIKSSEQKYLREHKLRNLLLNQIFIFQFASVLINHLALSFHV